MNTTIERISKIADIEGIKLTNLETKIGASKGVLTRALSQKTDIQSKWITRLVENYPNYDAGWILTGKGDMLKEGEQTQLYKLRGDRTLKHQLIPLYDLEASAGLVQLFQDSNSVTPIDTISIPNLPKCDGALYVVGDSMYPLLKSGDIVMYKQVHDLPNDFFWGEMYLVHIDMDGDTYTTVKYIQRSEIGPEHIKLVSYNQHHSPKDIHLSRIRAAALVKASVRVNSMM